MNSLNQREIDWQYFFGRIINFMTQYIDMAKGLSFLFYGATYITTILLLAWLPIDMSYPLTYTVPHEKLHTISTAQTIYLIVK